MKKMILALLALAFAATTFAGSLTTVPQGVSRGKFQRDATNLQDVQENYARGIKWGIATAYSVASNSSTNVTLTGASTYYYGPYYLLVSNTGPTSVCASPVTFVSALTASEGEITNNITSRIVGPISQTMTHVGLIGLTATATGKYQIGWLE